MLIKYNFLLFYFHWALIFVNIPCQKIVCISYSLPLFLLPLNLIWTFPGQRPKEVKRRTVVTWLHARAQPLLYCDVVIFNHVTPWRIIDCFHILQKSSKEENNARYGLLWQSSCLPETIALRRESYFVADAQRRWKIYKFCNVILKRKFALPFLRAPKYRCEFG